ESPFGDRHGGGFRPVLLHISLPFAIVICLHGVRFGRRDDEWPGACRCCLSRQATALLSSPLAASGVSWSQCDCQQPEPPCTEQERAALPRSAPELGRPNEGR